LLNLKIALLNLNLPACIFGFKNQNQESEILKKVKAKSESPENGEIYHFARILDRGKES